MKIFCDKCKKPVDEIITHYSFADFQQTIKVKCHGETDEMTMSDQVLMEIDVVALEKAIGLAFISTPTKSLAFSIAGDFNQVLR